MPRILSEVASLASRFTCTPEIRESESAIVASGNLPISSATIESTTLVAPLFKPIAAA